MPIAEFTTPLSIIQCKSGDSLVFETEEVTPLDYQLTVKDMDGATLYGPVSYNVARNGMLYWYITASASHGFSGVLTYYEVIISDGETNSYPDITHIVYINNHAAFEDYITRALGLSGHNARRFGHTWIRGLLTGFYLKFYATATDLSAAIAGTSDNYLGYYQVAIAYDENYNRIELSSTKLT